MTPMAYATREDITARVRATFDACPSQRLKEVMTTLVDHLHGFARETGLTAQEWLLGVDFLFRAGQISDAARNEFMVLSDALGLTALVELMEDADEERTPTNNLGPFYVEDVPTLPFNADLRGDRPGTPMLLRGRVLGADGEPIPGASINLWQTQHDGRYDVQVPGLDEYRYRGWLRTDPQGVYQVRTIKPVGYTAPMDGPVGQMLRATARSPWRPAHVHFLIRAAGHRPLITEVYPQDTPHLEDDVAFGPRAALVVAPVEVRDRDEGARVGLSVPFVKLEFDFKLSPAEPGSER